MYFRIYYLECSFIIIYFFTSVEDPDPDPAGSVINCTPGSGSGSGSETNNFRSTTLAKINNNKRTNQNNFVPNVTNYFCQIVNSSNMNGFSYRQNIF